MKIVYNKDNKYYLIYRRNKQKYPNGGLVKWHNEWKMTTYWDSMFTSRELTVISEKMKQLNKSIRKRT